MGREIRRVPAGWQHPTQPCPHSPWAGGCDRAKANNGRCYHPVYDRSYKEAADKWLKNCLAWVDGTHPEAAEHKSENPYWWDWDGMPPDEEYYRPDWTEAPAHYQMYETVSEGTPVSPVFATLGELAAWMVSEAGYSEAAARNFVQDGWAPSMIGIPGVGLVSGVEGLALLKRD